MRIKTVFNLSFLLLMLAFSFVTTESHADEFADFVNPLVAKHCLKCHGGEKVNG